MQIFSQPYYKNQQTTFFTFNARTKTVVAKLSEPKLKRFEESLFQRIVEKLKSNVSYEQIAKEEALSVGQIKYLRKKALAKGLIKTIPNAYEKRRFRVVELANSGKVVEEIAQAENLSKVSVAAILKEAGVSILTAFQKRKNERDEKILKMLLDGIPRKQIAEKFGVNIVVVNGVAEKHSTYRTVHNRKIQRINEKLESGLSINEVAVSENINPSTVSRNAVKKASVLRKNEQNERNQEIANEIQEGISLEQVAKNHGISIQRARQIKSSLGLTKTYNFLDNPYAFRFDEIKDASRDITTIRKTYQKFKKGERTPEILDSILETVEIFKRKIEQLKSHFD